MANILLAFMINTGVAFTNGIGHPVFNDGVVVTAPPEKGSPADIAGIRKNDILIKVQSTCNYSALEISSHFSLVAG